MGGDIGHLDCRTEAGDVVVGLALTALGAAPGVVGIGYPINVGVTKRADGAGFHVADVAGVDEEGLSTAVTCLVPVWGTPLVRSQEPSADGNLRSVEQLARQGDDALHQVG